MNIILNNRNEELDANELSMQELILLKNYTFKLLVTKINGSLVKKVDRAEAIIREGDKVDVIHMISGG